VRIAVDVGGTFTDVVVLEDGKGELRYEKVSSLPRDPATGVVNGFDKANADLARLDYFVHGTTLGLNALLTRRGGPVAIVTTRGFRDVYEIGRTNREPSYDFTYRKPPTLVPRSLVLEVAERVTHKGQVLVPIDRESAIAAARRLAGQDIRAVAICFLHSYAHPDHELEMAEIIRQECPGLFVTVSHELSREYREYERTSTAVIDAYVKGITVAYLERLEAALLERGFAGKFLLTRSGGGAMTVAAAKRQPVQLVLSGPAGGVMGAAALGEAIGHRNLITMDMGGTSLDASLIVDGQPKVEITQQFETLPVSIPTIDIHTIGAGGGSIAWVDEGGHLQFGPQSAGADPGPACYGKGGDEPTFTDAALAVGYLDPANFLGGEIPLDVALTEAAIGRVAGPLGLSADDTAVGILRLATAKIVSAVRLISIEQGHHPRDFAIIAFGGAGAFLAADVARELSIPNVVVPTSPGTFSAFGMLMADVVTDVSQTLIVPFGEDSLAALNGAFAELATNAAELLEREGHPRERWAFAASLEMRYRGQEHSVNIALASYELRPADVSALVERFGVTHAQHYGHRTSDPVEVVTVRLRAIARIDWPELPHLAPRTSGSAAPSGERLVHRAGARGPVPYAVYDRRELLAGDVLRGPAIVEEPSSTTVVHEGDEISVGQHGELLVAVAAPLARAQRTGVALGSEA
jgi:N-methylhydantoinase A